MPFAISGFAHGISSMFGLGQVWNPMKQYQDDLSKAQAKLTTLVQEGTLDLLEANEKTQAQFYETFQSYVKFNNEQVKASATIEQFGVSENQTSIMILAAVVLVIIMYLVLAPK